MSTVRFGLIGAGNIAIHSAKAILTHPQARIVAAHDPHAQRLAELAAAFEIPRTFADVNDLLACDEVDAVYIAVPNKFHAPLSIAALQAGKHVILDKPFALNNQEACAVAEAAAASGKVFTLGMNFRFQEGSQKIKSLVDAGMLGEIYHAKAYWFRREGIPKLGTWFGNKELAGGGCLLDIGVHLLDLCLYTLGRFDAVSVSGATYTKFGHRGLGEGGWGKSDRENLRFDVDDFATALIKFSDGLTVSLDVAWAGHAADASRNNVELYGTEAGASLLPPHIYRRDPYRSDYDVIDNPGGTLSMPHMDRFHNFINHLLADEPLCCTLDQALGVQRILDGIYESARTGQQAQIG